MKRIVTVIFMALAGVGVLALVGCAGHPDASARTHNAHVLTAQHGWRGHNVPAQNFTLQSFGPAQIYGGTLRVYIEGDGLAWVNRHTPSTNPTPREPLALKLALADKTGIGVYLGRPCQYFESSSGACQHNKWWTSHRFSPEVVASYVEAIDYLKRYYNAHKVELVGFSGGGVVAALVAAKRTEMGRADVGRIITVAAPLDTKKWVEHHKISVMAGSLNAADIASEISHIPQIHMAGGKDAIVPIHVLEAYKIRAHDRGVGMAARGAPIRIREIKGYEHICCWAEGWGDLLEESLH